MGNVFCLCAKRLKSVDINIICAQSGISMASQMILVRKTVVEYQIGQVYPQQFEKKYMVAGKYRFSLHSGRYLQFGSLSLFVVKSEVAFHIVVDWVRI